jgi:hypothetical protein
VCPYLPFLARVCLNQHQTDVASMVDGLLIVISPSRRSREVIDAFLEQTLVYRHYRSEGR